MVLEEEMGHFLSLVVSGQHLVLLVPAELDYCQWVKMCKEGWGNALVMKRMQQKWDCDSPKNGALTWFVVSLHHWYRYGLGSVWIQQKLISALFGYALSSMH